MKDARIIYKYDSKSSRGFGFVIFKNVDSVQRVLEDKEKHMIQGKWIDCKPAILKKEMDDLLQTKTTPQSRTPGAHSHQKP